MAHLIGKAPLAIDVEPLRRDHNDLVKALDRNHGRDHLATMLCEAGVTEGRWLFRVCDTYKTRGVPKPLQIRRFDHTGVHIWLKYGDNESGVKGVLVVTKDKEVTPEHLYNTLRAHVHPFDVSADTGRTALPTHYEPDEATTLAVLAAANVLAAQRWANLDSFLTAMQEIMGDDAASAADLLETLETLVDKELMSSHKTSYGVTPNGQARLDSAPKPVAPPPVPASVPPAAATGGPTDPIALIAQHRSKLERLLKLPELVAASRAEQQRLSTEIEKMMDRLGVEVAKEQEMLKECNADAVRALLGDK